MNRNATGLVATGALLSALASSPQRLAPAASTAGQARAVVEREQGEPGRYRLAAQLMARQPADVAAQARRDYTRDLARQFLDVCRGGLDGSEPAGPVGTSGAAAAAAKAVGLDGTGTEMPDGWSRRAFPDDPEAAWWLRRRQAAIDRQCRAQPQDFIVALVPDPVHTRLALVFDRLIEVIQEASQDQGFRFVRALTPWDPKAHAESEDFAIRLGDRVYSDGRREFPGLLAFRNERDQRKHLFVLLVGESPTGGVAKQQFANAVDWIAHTSGTAAATAPGTPGRPRPPRPPLRILGPTFSGSLASLAQLLACEPGTLGAAALNPGPAATPPSFQTSPSCGPALVFSGSVTDRAAILRFRASAASNRRSRCRPASPAFKKPTT
jgi:hypothetical protein